jgi:hypothetical protein
LTADATRALIASEWKVLGGGGRGDALDPRQFRAGVFRIMAAHIRRSDQGGYGSFSPATVEWEAPAEDGEVF